MIEQEQLAGVVRAEAHQANVGLEQFVQVESRFLLPIVTEHPDPARVVIAVNVCPSQLLEPLAVVDKSTSDRPEIGVIVLDDRHKNRRRAARALRPKRVAPFYDAPAVIAALFDAIDLLP